MARSRAEALNDRTRIDPSHLLGEVLRAGLADMNRKDLGRTLKPGVQRDWLAEAGSGAAPLSTQALKALTSYEGFSDEQRVDLTYGNILLQVVHKRPPKLQLGAVEHAIGFVGPTNHDFIVGHSSYTSRGLDLPLSGEYPERKSESYDDFLAEFRNVMRVFDGGAPAYKYEYGGSPFNVACTAAATGLGFRVKYVGVAGGVHTELVKGQVRSHAEVAKFDLGMDTTYFSTSPNFGGHCLAVCAVHDERLQRQMSVLPPEDQGMYEHLVTNFWGIVAYLARCKVVHLGSLFDEKSPDVLATLIEEVVRLNPNISISFDPGSLWSKADDNSAEHQRAIRRILQQSNLVFASETEVANLANSYVTHRSGDTLENYAQRVHELLDASASTVLVVKRRGVIELSYARKPLDTVELLPPLADNDIEDDTGAGDAFAGAFLAARMKGLDDRRSAYLGLRVARDKLQVLGHPARGLVQLRCKRSVSSRQP